MKIEPRGKYPGVKLHLDKQECYALLNTGVPINKMEAEKNLRFVVEVAKKIKNLMKEVPHLLEERTEAQIAAELQLEIDKSKAKLKAMASGADWKKVKVS